MATDNSSIRLRSSSRERRFTEKGLDYHVSQLTDKLRSAISSWRSTANKLEVLMSDNGDIYTMRQERSKLQENFAHLSNTYSDLRAIVSGEELPSSEFVDIETRNFDLIRDIGNYIRSAECEKSELRSQASKSRRSRSARQNKSSRSQDSRSSYSQYSSRSEAAVQAATLKAKLKYVDVESRTKAELEKIQIKKEIDMAEARIEALNVTDRFLPMDTSTVDRVREYVDAHAHFENFSDADEPVIPPIKATLTPHTQIHTEKKNIDSAVCTKSSSICSSPLLNPTVPDFVPCCPVLQFSTAAPPLDIVTTVSASSVVLPTNTNTVVSPCIYQATSAKGSTDQGLIDLAKTLAEQVSLNRLPSPEPGIFYGDPIQYPSWKLAFKTLVDSRHIPAAERIHYLKKYIGGPVKQMVDSYFLLSSDNAYDEAKKILDERYGDPFIVANAFRTKLDSWPKISPRDSYGLQKFADFLKQCLAAMETIPHLSVLSDTAENRKMLTKLPEWLVGRWNRLVVDHKEKHHDFPQFSSFESFIAKEAKIACNPVTSLQSIKGELNEAVSKHAKPDRKPPFKGRSLRTETDEHKHQVKMPSFPRIQCPFCKRYGHELDVCYLYLAKNLSERKTFAQENKLCFGCLNPGHISKGCKNRKQCQTCLRFHPTSLHGDLKDGKSSHSQKGSTAAELGPTKAGVNEKAQALHLDSFCLNGPSSLNKCTMVVPVFLSQRDNPYFERLVYAMLDCINF